MSPMQFRDRRHLLLVLCLISFAAGISAADSEFNPKEAWTKAKAYVKSAVTKDEDFKLPSSVLASWRDSGCRRVSPFASDPCKHECNVVVSTLEAKVNPLTQNYLVDIASKLQDAVNAASVAATRRGLPLCMVTLPKGRYTITKSIIVPSRVHIMGNSAAIELPQRSSHFSEYFPAFVFEGEGVQKANSADVPLFTFSTPPSKPIGPGKQIILPSDVAAAAAKVLARKERVVLRAYLLGVPDMKQFQDTQHKMFFENYADVVHGWGADPIGFLVEVLSVSSSNVAQLRSSLPFKFHQFPFALQMIPASKFVTNSALTDLFLTRPPVSPSDVKIIQANYCEGGSNQCKTIQAAFASMRLDKAVMVVMRFTLDVQIARNSMNGILRSGTWMDNTLHACFHNNIVTNAHLFGDTGPGFGNGVTLSEYSSYNSVVTNTFSTLRHAMLLQFGANSNVIANNKNDKIRCQLCRPSPVSDASARKNVASLIATLKKLSLGLINIATPLEYSWGKVILHDLALNTSEPAVSTACANVQYDDESREFSALGQNVDWCADISFHGLFSNNNLVEGNDVESIKIADFYGPSPSNVVFGNRINSGTLSVVVDRASTDTILVDNLFTNGGITFLDDASTAKCINNKKCSGKSCDRQPGVSQFSLFSATCNLISKFSSPLESFAQMHPKYAQFVQWVTDGCAYWDRNTGGKKNKFECIEDNIIGVTARPESLFADKTLKACTGLKPECFDGIQRPAEKLSCDVKSPPPPAPTSDSKFDGSDVGDGLDTEADMDGVYTNDDDMDADLDELHNVLDEDGSDEAST